MNLIDRFMKSIYEINKIILLNIRNIKINHFPPLCFMLQYFFNDLS